MVILVGESICLWVAQLFEIRQTGVLDHRWWTAHENDRLRAGGGQMLLHHFGVDEARAG